MPDALPDPMSNRSTDPAEKNLVRSLAKGFRVLEAFAPDTPELALAEVARRAGVDNATAFRLLNTLVMLGYVARKSRHSPLPPDAQVPRSRLQRDRARPTCTTFARPILRSLVGSVNEAASIGVLEGAEVVYVARVQAGLTRLGVDVRIGSRVPVHSTAIGQAILAFCPRETQVRILSDAPREKLTPYTLTEIDALLEKLAEVRKLGWALSEQENVTGLRVLSAPVLDIDGVPAAGLSVAAPAFRMPAAEFEAAARDPVLAAAAQLSRALQATGSFAVQTPHT